mmetsp:Transcript_30998/g.55507  ORF Transcript_30998/g.55507 Transcript_30998/m.55507 type:complete len:495 (-) Transcript_30998:118-1602(-)
MQSSARARRVLVALLVTAGCAAGWTEDRARHDVYHPHFDTSPDYLSIATRARGVNGNSGHKSDNYYLVIGDWGAFGGTRNCRRQKEVARLMANYVRERREINEHSTLLFVLSVGDNFYWTGATEQLFKQAWADVYDPEILEVPWFAVMGNHDYGNADPGAGCPNVRPRFVCDEDNLYTSACGGDIPYSFESQAYDGNQLNVGKGGVGGELRKNFHMPDYTYYYSIPELDFELVAVDWNWAGAFPGGLGGNGLLSGGNKMLKHCGSDAILNVSLQAVQDASTTMMLERAWAAKANNIAIISHYPDLFQSNQNLRELYLSYRPNGRKEDATIFNFYGHTHWQECRTTDGTQCIDFLTGGGGGCCEKKDTPAGFVVIRFDDDGKQKVECFADRDSDQKGETGRGRRCTLPRYNATKHPTNPAAAANAWAQETAWEVELAKMRGKIKKAPEKEDHRVKIEEDDDDYSDRAEPSCDYTVDNPRCPNYRGPSLSSSDSFV